MRLEDLVTAARAGGDAPTLSDRERIRAKLSARLRGEGFVASDFGAAASGVRLAAPAPAASSATKDRLRRTRWLVRGLMAAALLAVGTASALEARRLFSRHLQQRPAPAAPAAVAAPSPATLNAPGEVAAPAPVASPSPPSRAARGPATHAPPDSTGAAAAAPGLADELDLVRQARAALHRGAPGDALALLERRDERHPAGALGQEAAALRILALCDLGRPDEARARGAAFLRSWPRSPLVSRIEGSCAARPDPVK